VKRVSFGLPNRQPRYGLVKSRFSSKWSPRGLKGLLSLLTLHM